MNSIALTGRLGKDAEVSYTTTSGVPVVSFSLAVQRTKEITDWFMVRHYGDNAERISEWLTKGRLVAVSGSLETFRRKKDETTGFTVVANRVEFLDKAPDREKAPAPAGDAESEDVPF